MITLAPNDEPARPAVPDGQGDQQAVLTPEQIFHDCAPWIYTLARRLLGNEADAEDVTQQVFVQLMGKLSTYRGEAAFATWLHRVTINTALAFRRQRALQKKHQVAYDPLEDFQQDGSHRVPVRRWMASPEKLAIEQETHDLIEAAISQLPETYRDVYVLADVEQLSNQHIAEMLGLSVAAVKSRLHRARLMMRHALAPHFEERAA